MELNTVYVKLPIAGGDLVDTEFSIQSQLYGLGLDDVKYVNTGETTRDNPVFMFVGPENSIYAFLDDYFGMEDYSSKVEVLEYTPDAEEEFNMLASGPSEAEDVYEAFDLDFNEDEEYIANARQFAREISKMSAKKVNDLYYNDYKFNVHPAQDTAEQIIQNALEARIKVDENGLGEKDLDTHVVESKKSIDMYDDADEFEDPEDTADYYSDLAADSFWDDDEEEYDDGYEDRYQKPTYSNNEELADELDEILDYCNSIGSDEIDKFVKTGDTTDLDGLLDNWEEEFESKAYAVKYLKTLHRLQDKQYAKALPNGNIEVVWMNDSYDSPMTVYLDDILQDRIDLPDYDIVKENHKEYCDGKIALIKLELKTNLNESMREAKSDDGYEDYYELDIQSAVDTLTRTGKWYHTSKNGGVAVNNNPDDEDSERDTVLSVPYDEDEEEDGYFVFYGADAAKKAKEVAKRIKDKFDVDIDVYNNDDCVEMFLPDDVALPLTPKGQAPKKKVDLLDLEVKKSAEQPKTNSAAEKKISKKALFDED